jgi:hypothetical protein
MFCDQTDAGFQGRKALLHRFNALFQAIAGLPALARVSPFSLGLVSLFARDISVPASGRQFSLGLIPLPAGFVPFKQRLVSLTARFVSLQERTADDRDAMVKLSSPLLILPRGGDFRLLRIKRLQRGPTRFSEVSRQPKRQINSIEQRG